MFSEEFIALAAGCVAYKLKFHRQISLANFLDPLNQDVKFIEERSFNLTVVFLDMQIIVPVHSVVTIVQMVMPRPSSAVPLASVRVSIPLCVSTDL